MDISEIMNIFPNCANFNVERQTLFIKIATIDGNILTENQGSIENQIVRILLIKQC